MEIDHKGVRVRQAENGHVQIFGTSNGREFWAHFSCGSELSEKQLRKTVDRCLRMRAIMEAQNAE